MNNQNQNIPKLRFSDFIGEWEKKRLGDICDILMGQSPNGDSYNTEGIGVPLINGPVEFTEKYPIKIKWTSNPTKYCQDGDVLFCVRGSTTGRMNIANDKYCIGRGVAAIRANSKSTSPFVELILINNLVKILSYTTGSTFQNIDSKSLKEYQFNIPTLPEQQKIASFFTTIDQKISQLKQKLTLLKQYKKGVMQKIFSQEPEERGSRTPSKNNNACEQIRFKDDNGYEFPKWETKKLGELDIYISDGNYGELYPRADQMVSQGVPFIRANNIKNLKLSMDDMKFIDSEHHKILTSGHLKTGDILVTTRGDIGMLAYVDEEFNNANINAQICLLRVNSSLNAEYLLNFLSSRWGIVQFKSLQTGSALKQLPKSNLSKILINLPCIKEQTKIADFLSGINDKINHTHKQIEKAETWKKGLLQQMFV
ncbi:MAG TPA: restriction endonuclease subunit S [Bacteroidales bacterium]|nr:restriction endonuclease subunit S [Bacteroidales bacterium]